jgi:hypothetical protein
MSAHVICHWQRSKSPEGDEARAQLAQRVFELWEGTLELNGTWIVQHSEETSDQLRDELLPYVPEGDALIVIGAAQDAAWVGFAPAESEWLLEHI